MDKLEEYFNRLLPYVDCSALVAAFSVNRVLRKGDFLIQPGDRTSFLAFIVSGSFRVFFIDRKGNEMTTWFSLESMFVTDLLSYYRDRAAIYFVEAMEESEVSIIQKSQLERLYLTFPAYREFGRKFAENGMVLLMERMVSLQTKTAEERYLDLLDDPALMQQIPLKHLASYLGITDTSLSRIRRNILKP